MLSFMSGLGPKFQPPGSLSPTAICGRPEPSKSAATSLCTANSGPASSSTGVHDWVIGSAGARNAHTWLDGPSVNNVETMSSRPSPLRSSTTIFARLLKSTVVTNSGPESVVYGCRTHDDPSPLTLSYQALPATMSGTPSPSMSATCVPIVSPVSTWCAGHGCVGSRGCSSQNTLL